MVEDVFGVRYLYHATYLPYYKEIKKEGKIVAGRHKNWDMSSGCIYLARDEEVAISYAETSEMFQRNTSTKSLY